MTVSSRCAACRGALDDCELFELSVDDRLGFDLHPALENGRVGRAKIDVVLQIPERQVIRTERGILPVHAAGDAITQQEGYAAGAVVGACTVVLDTPTKLRPH